VGKRIWTAHNRTLDAAAQHGQLEVLGWALGDRESSNSDLCANAAFGGHLEVLKFLREIHCSCLNAAEAGNFEVGKRERMSLGGNNLSQCSE